MRRSFPVRVHPLFPLIGIFAISSFFVGCILGFILHTLSQDGLWQADKMKVGLSIFGAEAFYESPVALSQGSLNLGAWHGFHQVTTRTTQAYDSLSFDFNLDSDSYLVFLYDGLDDGSRYIRLSNNQYMPSIAGYTDKDGRFIRQVTLGIDVSPKQWHSVRIVHHQDITTVMLDGNQIAKDTDPFKSLSTFGFRGGEKSAYVDNVIATKNGVTVFSDGFDFFPSICMFSGTAFLCLMIFTAFFVFLGVRSGRGYTPAYIFAVSVAIIALIISPAIYYYQKNYPNESLPTILTRLHPVSEDTQYIPVLRTIDEDIAHLDASSSAYVILYIGTSQLWGAGATDRKHTFAAEVTDILQSQFPSKHVQGINFGISGLESTRLLGYLQHRRFDAVKPSLIIADLSTNDADYRVPTDVYADNLQRIIQFGDSVGAKVIFIPEPNSPEHDHTSIGVYHNVMRTVAATYGIPVIELDTYLTGKNNTGFLWWDYVHMTQYGHNLTAQFLSERIEEIMRASSASDSSVSP